jgi:hypothetical protein
MLLTRMILKSIIEYLSRTQHLTIDNLFTSHDSEQGGSLTAHADSGAKRAFLMEFAQHRHHVREQQRRYELQ